VGFVNTTPFGKFQTFQTVDYHQIKKVFNNQRIDYQRLF
jgi:hypothetical protein